jgi:hypothetical protein
MPSSCQCRSGIHCGAMKSEAETRSKADWPADLEIRDGRLHTALRQVWYSLPPWPSSLNFDAYWIRCNHLCWWIRSGGLSQNCPSPGLEPTPSWLIFDVFVTRFILVTLSEFVFTDGPIDHAGFKQLFLISVSKRTLIEPRSSFLLATCFLQSRYQYIYLSSPQLKPLFLFA